MAPAPLREQLEDAFRFDASDLDANRNGRLSPRQAERLRAAKGVARIALAVFAAVTLGSGFLVARSVAPEHVRWAMGAAAAVALIGFAISRGSLAALGSRTISIAEGLARADDQGRLCLGEQTLVLGAPAQLDAFAPGAAYRVYYVAGPRALVLSAEALDERAEPGPLPAPGDPAEDEVVATAGRARVIVVALAVLIVDAPLLILLARELPDRARIALYAAVILECVGFAVFARWWLGRRR